MSARRRLSRWRAQVERPRRSVLWLPGHPADSRPSMSETNSTPAGRTEVLRLAVFLVGVLVLLALGLDARDILGGLILALLADLLLQRARE
jgi:hypothetical protein